MAERSGKGLQNLIRRFDSVCDLVRAVSLWQAIVRGGICLYTPYLFFAEDASIIVSVEVGEEPEPYKGDGTCYLEFGEGKVGKVDVDFFSGPKPTGRYIEAFFELNEDKKLFRSSRQKRWFGLLA